MKKLSQNTTARQGFTLVEVMVASLVLTIMILSALGALIHGFRLLDSARNTTLAAQIAQSEIEDLRLQPWSKISDPALISHSGPIDLSASIGKLLGAAEGEAIAQRFSASRLIVDVPDRGSTLKRVTIAVAWHDYNGTTHTRSYETLIGQHGLTDYFVANHTPTP
jgi:prepilin-type N-terminal cleavage/methylation domain-containing protein